MSLADGLQTVGTGSLVGAGIMAAATVPVHRSGTRIRDVADGIEAQIGNRYMEFLDAKDAGVHNSPKWSAWQAERLETALKLVDEVNPRLLSGSNISMAERYADPGFGVVNQLAGNGKFRQSGAVALGFGALMGTLLGISMLQLGSQLKD